MTANQSPSIPMFWDCNHFVGNVGIQNIFARTTYQVDLQNNHFAGNTIQDKTDKDYEIRIIGHSNESFQQYFETSVSNVLMNMWLNSKDVPVSCPNIIKFYNDGMDYVDIMDKKNKTMAYRSMLKASITFTWACWSHGCHTCKQSYCLHETWWWHIATEFQNCCSKRLWLIDTVIVSRSFPTTRQSKLKSHEPTTTTEIPIHMPEFQ